jgi:adenosylcobinamide kinase/adenosylcobinamide-phosphate guanylyltransferase
MSMRIVLVVGGARSGKSSHAERLAKEEADGGPVSYVATAIAGDADMTTRIDRHRSDRPESWETIEDSTGALGIARATHPVIVLDCATMMLANAIRGEAGKSREAVDRSTMVTVDALLHAARAREGTLFLVTNEVGMSIHPVTPLGMWFQDAMGRANQRLAAAAHETVLMVCGIPLTLTGSGS